MSKPILIITGACGRLGSAAAALFSEQFQVIGLDVYIPKNPIDGVEYLCMDLRLLDNVKDTFHQIREKHGGAIASVIHLAAYYNFEGGGWDQYQAITIDGTDHLLTALQDFQLEQLIFSSTMLVHAPCQLGEKINEASPVVPKWEYPLSKVKTEELIHEKCQKASSVILRIAGIYSDQCDSIPLSQHIMRIFEKKFESHLFPGNVNHGTSFLHIDDLMRALQSLVEKRAELPKEEVFVLGEPEVMSYKQLQHAIGTLLYGNPWWTIRIPKWIAKLGVTIQGSLPFFKQSFIKTWMIDLADDHYDLEIKKICNTLGWEPIHSLKNSLPKMIELLKSNPKKWIQDHGF